MHPVNIITSTWHLLSSSFCVAPLDLLGLGELFTANEAGHSGRRMTRLPLHTWRNFLYMLPAEFLYYLDQLQKIRDAEQ